MRLTRLFTRRVIHQSRSSLARWRVIPVVALLLVAGGLLAACVPSSVSSHSSDRESTLDKVGTRHWPPLPADAHKSDEAHYMARYFKWITAMQQAVIADDIDRARAHAGRMQGESFSSKLPDDWRPYFESIRALAGQAEKAANLEQMAGHIGQLAGQCRDCHRAYDADIRFEVAGSPGSANSNEAIMRRHDLAAALMWRGLISDSQTQWRQGADELVAAPLSRDEHTPDQVSALASDFQAIASGAGVATGMEQATLYGQLLARCGGCHRALSVTD